MTELADILACAPHAHHDISTRTQGMTEKIRIAALFGHYEMHMDGSMTWHHNPRLPLSCDQQQRHNAKTANATAAKANSMWTGDKTSPAHARTPADI